MSTRPTAKAMEDCLYEIWVEEGWDEDPSREKFWAAWDNGWRPA